MPDIIKPKALREGSTVGVAAPSGAFLRDKFEKGVAVLESCGFRVKFSENIFRKSGYFAGTDGERVDELNALFADPDVEAVMFARGGYGIQRIMPLLDFSAFEKSPKIVLGFSDSTSLLSFIVSRLNTACFYGPVVTLLSDAKRETLESLKHTLTSKDPVRPLNSNLKVMRKGEVTGRLSGGCLTLLSTGIGTDFETNVRDSILFLEDVGEYIYRYDRLLTHLKNSGMFEEVMGIVFGSMGLVQDETEKQLWSVVDDLLGDFQGPVVYGLKSGHTDPFMTMPIGIRCTLSAKDSGSLVFEEAALS